MVKGFKLKKLKPKQKQRIKLLSLGALLVLIMVPLVGYLTYRGLYYRKFFPVQVGPVKLTQLTQAQAQARLNQEAEKFLGQKQLELQYEDQLWTLSFEALNLKYDLGATTAQAYAIGRREPIREHLTTHWRLMQVPARIPLVYRLDESAWKVLIATMAAVIDQPVIKPAVKLTRTTRTSPAEIVIEPGQNGRQLQTAALTEMISQQLGWLETGPITVPTQPVVVVADEVSFIQAKAKAEKLLGKSLILTLKADDLDQSWTLTDEEMIKLMEVGRTFDDELLSLYLTQKAQEINRPAQDAVFRFNEVSGRVEEFTPAKEGLAVDLTTTKTQLDQALKQLINNDSVEAVELAVMKTAPAVTLAKVNTLGISELIGRGTSTYQGSIPSRVHNVALAAEHISGALIKPGEVFDFNQVIGDVSAKTGYQQAYIIINGRTELGDGGGVCQVSTTTFRAALDAGLPIVERQAHAYRVGYYEQDTKAGIDATVYAPSPNLKFLNDTPAHILVQATAETPKRALTVDIYGTSDGRVTTITNHAVWDITPPPPDLIVDDPTLPAGTMKQVDWKASGAKAKFDYTVERGGSVILEKTFYSAYKPWASVFMKGTGPI